MPAITIDPTAMTVAGEEPERAANIMQAKTDAIARPPGTCPTTAIANRMTRRATPPVAIKVDAKMKNGTANNV